MEILMNMGHKRLLAMTLCGGFVLLPLLFGQQGSDQQTPAKPKKVLTPEQKVYRQQWKEYMAKRQGLQAQAKAVFDAEMAREKAGDCPEAKTTYDFNICYGEQTAITEENLKSYEGIIRELMAPQPRMPGESATEMHGPAGAALRRRSKRRSSNAWSKTGGSTARQPARLPFTSSTEAREAQASRWNAN
jgi:hypothetical protein